MSFFDNINFTFYYCWAVLIIISPEKNSKKKKTFYFYFFALHCEAINENKHLLSVASYLAHRRTGNTAALNVTPQSLKSLAKGQTGAETFRLKKANIYSMSSTTGNALNPDATSNLNLHFNTWMNGWGFFLGGLSFVFMTWFWFSTPDNLPPWCVSGPPVLVIYCKNMFL